MFWLDIRSDTRHLSPTLKYHYRIYSKIEELLSKSISDRKKFATNSARQNARRQIIKNRLKLDNIFCLTSNQPSSNI